MLTEQLISRLEKLEGPCRETDALIWKLYYPSAYERTYQYPRIWKDQGANTKTKLTLALRRVADLAPWFTRSQDTVQVLWPPRWKWVEMRLRDDDAFAVHGQRETPPFARTEGVHKRLEVAICIAALRAQMMEDEG